MQSGRQSLLVFSVSGWHHYSLSSPPAFLPGKSRRQRSLVGYNPQDDKELDTTQRLDNSLRSYSSQNLGVPDASLFLTPSINIR